MAALVNVPLPFNDYDDGMKDGYASKIIFTAHHTAEYMAGYNAGVKEADAAYDREYPNEL